MGITNFNKWLRTNYPIVYSNIKQSYDNLYIDINPILHISINNCTNYTVLIKRIKLNIDNILSKIKPTKNLIFSTDGIPSVAKMILQRERRIAMIRNINIVNESKFINPIILTPETDFMKKLYDELKDHFAYLEEKYNIKVISLLNEPIGESEFKLFNKLKKLSIKYPDDTHAFVSNDADVVVMSMALNKNIFVIYNEKQFKQVHEIDIKKLNNLFKNHLDVCLAILMMGNDYLPKVGYLNLNKIIEIMKDKKIVECRENKINIDYTLLADILFELFKKDKRCKISSIYQLNLTKMKNYMEGLTWCITDYCNAKSKNMFYMYKYKKLVINPIELMYFLMINKKNPISYPLKDSNIEIHRNIYPSIVMPYKVRFLFDKKYSDFLLEKHKIMYEEELCEFCSEIHKNMSICHDSMNYLINYGSGESDDIEIDNIKLKIHDLNIKMKKHKKTHKKLCYDEIITIIRDLKDI